MKRYIVLAAVAVMAPTAAFAQWSDGFESYATGPLSSGGWDGWDGSAGARGIVTNSQAFSGSQSIQITGGGDAVHPFAGQFTSGLVSVTAKMLMLTGDHTADTFFIINNEYNHGGPYTWTTEMQFDVATGNVLDDFRPETNTIAIVFDRWVDLQFDFDLDNDIQTAYYDGVELSTGTMTRSAGDPLEIANIDLFTTGATSYYDDIAVTPVPEPASMIALGTGLVVLLRRRRKSA